MGWFSMGAPRRIASPRDKTSLEDARVRRNTGPRNPDGTWMAGMVRGPYRPFPFPVGTQFGDLTVIRWDHYTSRDGKPWGYRPVCRCTCGAENMVYASSLKAGRSTRCNICAKVAAAAKRYWAYKHAMADDEHRARLLNRLSSAIARCTNPKNASFKHYGLRGISVAAEWRDDRTTFLRHVQTLPGWDDPALEMDRRDTNGSYEPGNVRFVTKRANIKNKRRLEDLEQRIRDLERDNANLRSRKRRP